MVINTKESKQEVESWCYFYSPAECSCKYFNNLELNCSARALTYIPDLTEDSKWQSIDMKKNPIGKLNRYEFANIIVIELDLSSCSLSKIHRNAFMLSKGIQKLSLAHNELTVIPNEMGLHLGKLKWLDISYNPLKHVNFDELFKSSRYNIEVLNFDGIKTLQEIDLAKLTNLINVSMNNMSLMLFPSSRGSKISIPSNLRSLQLSYNNISDINVQEHFINNINYLNLSQNLLTKFPGTLKSKSMNILDISHNMLETLPGWMLKMMPELNQLIVNNNRIQKISKKFLCQSGRNLSIVNLEYNQITDFPMCALINHSEFNGVPTIQLNGNNMSCLCRPNVSNYIILWEITLHNCWFNDTIQDSIWRTDCNEYKLNECEKICLDNKDDPDFIMSYKVGRHNSAANNFGGTIFLLSIMSAIWMTVG
ncbi:hypothetical protein GJ496_007451 [Pomphorhynchus laevis]|nr:hypothetical protein GJ496_007451 [Pomphorhynchus laevis]